VSHWFKQLFSAPVFEDEDKTRVAGLLHSILLTFIAVSAVITVLIPLLYGRPGTFEEAFTLLSGAVMAGLGVWLLFLTRRGHIHVAGLLLTGTLWSIITYWTATVSGIVGDTSLLSYPLIIALAGMLVGARAAIGFTLACSLALIGVYWAEVQGVLVVVHRPPDTFDPVMSLAGLVLMGLLVRYSVRSTDLGFERARRNERDMENSNQQLLRVRTMLEQRNAHMQSTVQRYVDNMAKLAHGNLAVRMPLDEGEPDTDDPLVVLGRSLNTTIASLQHMAAQIRDQAGHLSTAVATILSTTTQQAAGAGEQSAAIAQASSTIDEIRTIAEQTSLRARGIVDLAQHTADVSRAGEQAVGDAVEGMNQIKIVVEMIAAKIQALSEQSRTIDQIVSSINEIAIQSNLLALNAAVEAARAGQAGRGFAVVAQEVRNLSEQSQTATERVREILSEIQQGIQAAVAATGEGLSGANTGMGLAQESGLAIQQLAESVQVSTQAAVQIAAESEQQASGMAQITQAMDNIHRVTAQSVDGAHKMEQAAGELDALAGQLRALVEQYQL